MIVPLSASGKTTISVDNSRVAVPGVLVGNADGIVFTAFRYKQIVSKFGMCTLDIVGDVEVCDNKVESACKIWIVFPFMPFPYTLEITDPDRMLGSLMLLPAGKTPRTFSIYNDVHVDAGFTATLDCDGIIAKPDVGLSEQGGPNVLHNVVSAPFAREAMMITKKLHPETVYMFNKVGEPLKVDTNCSMLLIMVKRATISCDPFGSVRRVNFGHRLIVEPKTVATLYVADIGLPLIVTKKSDRQDVCHASVNFIKTCEPMIVDGHSAYELPFVLTEGAYATNRNVGFISRRRDPWIAYDTRIANYKCTKGIRLASCRWTLTSRHEIHTEDIPSGATHRTDLPFDAYEGTLDKNGFQFTAQNPFEITCITGSCDNV
jgi:hypothetical protein